MSLPLNLRLGREQHLQANIGSCSPNDSGARLRLSCNRLPCNYNLSKYQQIRLMKHCLPLRKLCRPREPVASCVTIATVLAAGCPTLPLANAPPVGLSFITRSPSGVFKMMAPIPIIPLAAGVADACSCRAATAEPACRAEDATRGLGALGEGCIRNSKG